MVHLSDLSWSQSGEEAVAPYKKGDTVSAKVLDVDVEKERISLGIKQLEEDPFESGISSVKRGTVVTGTVTAILDNAIEVQIGDGIPGIIRKVDLSRDRGEQRPDRFAPGEKVDAKVTQIDHATRRLVLSIKAREIEEEKKAVATYGSSDSGASLGDILGAAIKEKRESAERAEAAQGGSAAAEPEGDATEDDAAADAGSAAGDAAETSQAEAAEATDAAEQPAADAAEVEDGKKGKRSSE
jgi:small subunit ribosomal protein S1